MSKRSDCKKAMMRKEVSKVRKAWSKLGEERLLPPTKIQLNTIYGIAGRK